MLPQEVVYEARPVLLPYQPPPLGEVFLHYG